MALTGFYAAVIMAVTITLLHVSVSCIDTKRSNLGQDPVPITLDDVAKINKQVKKIVIAETIPTLNKTARELKSLIKVCEVKLNKSSDSCNKCTTKNCASSSAAPMKKKTQDAHTKAICLLFKPLCSAVITIKIIERYLPDVCQLLGPEATRFVEQFVDIVKDVSDQLIKGADSIIKDSVKGLVEFGENLANFAKDIGEGLRKTVDNLAKDAVHISKQVLESIQKVGSEVTKAAEHTVKEAAKAISHISEQVGNVISDTGKAVHHVANEAGKAVHHAVRSVSRFIGRIFRGWGKRNVREKRLLDECQKVCPSCLQLHDLNPNQTVTLICGVDHVIKQDRLMQKIKLNQRLLNITLAAKENIVKNVTCDPNNYYITSAGEVFYRNPIVTLNINGTIDHFLSKEPFNPQAIAPFAQGIVDKLTLFVICNHKKCSIN